MPEASVFSFQASGGQYVVERQRHPTLKLIASLLHQTTLDLETALNEKAILLSKVMYIHTRRFQNHLMKVFWSKLKWSLSLKQALYRHIASSFLVKNLCWSFDFLSAASKTQ